HLRGRQLSGMVDPRDRLPAPQRAALEAADGDAPDVVVVGGRGDEELRGCVRVDIGRWDPLEDRVEQRLERRSLVSVIGARGPEDRIRVEGRELGVPLAGAEVQEEVEGLIEYMVRAGAGSVELF